MTTPNLISGELDQLRQLVDAHHSWRRECLNLCAAENAPSKEVRSWLAGDLSARYADYQGRDLSARKYYGTRKLVELEMFVTSLAEEVFDAREVELRPLSGHVAGNAIMMGLCRPGDWVFELDRASGGHRLAAKLATAPLIDLKVAPLPFDPIAYNLDIPAVLERVDALRPRLLIVGSSNFLFPYDLCKLSEGLRFYPETILVYDASHVLGLIAGGRFQNPLRDGSHLVLAGTQKSFPGPQGGVIYSNDPDIMEQVSAAVYPALLSNHHPARIPALGMALLEMKHYGQAYANQVIANARALAGALEKEGLSVVGSHLGGTESHTVVILLPEGDPASERAKKLDGWDIIVNAVQLPDSYGTEGLRIGTSEITRRGAREPEMSVIASILADAIQERTGSARIRQRVREYSQSRSGYEFSYIEDRSS